MGWAIDYDVSLNPTGPLDVLKSSDRTEAAETDLVCHVVIFIFFVFFFIIRKRKKNSYS